MLDLDTRTSILRLAAEAHGTKTIARLLGLSKNSVKKVLRSGQAMVPIPSRPEQLKEHLKLVRELHVACKGNQVRVHEELLKEGVDVPYSTLTNFTRRHGIGVKEKQRAGRYSFEPGQEMQHDTSPHSVVIGDRLEPLQCASLILCYSRKQYAKLYPRWSRFEARAFLSEAISWLGGSASDCMLDNSTVIIGSGTGKHAVAAPAMKALADRFGFTFIAHRVGDANRSGRVERPFHYIENNFYAGRAFSDLADLNRQLLQWCETNFHRYRKRLQASPVELFVAESPRLRPLPPHIPEIYDLHRRRVDVEGYVNLHTNRYSVDAALIGRQLEIRETVESVRVFDGHRLAHTHGKAPYGRRKRRTLPEHEGQQLRHRSRPQPSAQEVLLTAEAPELAELIVALRNKHGGRALKAVRHLHRLWLDYPTKTVVQAVGQALEYGLTDVSRIERMVLQQVAGDFFRLPLDQEESDD